MNTLSSESFIQMSIFIQIIYRAMGIPIEMYTVMFALGRLPGWIAQWCEMRKRKEPIGRPRQIYTGEQKRSFVSIDKR